MPSPDFFREYVSLLVSLLGHWARIQDIKNEFENKSFEIHIFTLSIKITRVKQIILKDSIMLKIISLKLYNLKQLHSFH